ncbi:SMP-30/gluconolactonase/LRE family protein [Tautonia plasticadhaerens]|uniref:Phytase-like domain-containing protein n=1 Tax=Tautonia plasticadhaerens TaxID=2527974 RepID=A0A518HA46_9BACT|nr:hypothetical protein [Tautonia plasticadhaerens]QDV37723.1 hypothetical protein ElP_56670 [Tautonia plasticadhaerens]
MTLTIRSAIAALTASALLSTAAPAAEDLTSGMDRGTPDLKSAGAMTFGPEGILFVGDTAGAAVFAIDTGDATSTAGGAIEAAKVNEAIAAALGTEPREILVNDLAVNPASGRAYLSVSRGRGPDAEPAIVRVDASGAVEVMDLADVPFAKAMLPNAPDPNAEERGRSLRAQAITDLVFADGRLFVAGLSNEEFSSRLLAIPVPFEADSNSASLEIYHGAHGRFETRSPIRTFVATQIQGEPYLMAAYTCTPLVKIPVADLKAGAHVKGTTVAELGNRNNPLDLVSYRKGGRDVLLVANSARGVMKVDAGPASSIEGITSPVEDTAGLEYETLGDLAGVVQLDRLDDTHALVLVQDDSGAQDLRTIELP